MRLLLDSHALLWAVDNPTRLGTQAAAELQNPANSLLVSAATIWEFAIKIGLKKLSLSTPFGVWMNQAITDLGLSILPIDVAYAEVQSALPSHHRDPFDRLLIAQAQVDNLTIASCDEVFDRYSVSRIW